MILSLSSYILFIQDLDAKLCKKTGSACTGDCHSKSATTGGRCENQVSKPVHIVGATAQWLKPTKIEELLSLLKKHSQDNYRLVFGNTGCGNDYHSSLSGTHKLIDDEGEELINP